MAFSVTYAGVPLCLDGAFAFRITPTPQDNPIVPDSVRIPRKHQVEADLMEEIYKIAPQVYANEFAMKSEFPGRNLSAIADVWNMGNPSQDQIRIGDFYYPCTASKWSVFRSIVGTRQKDAILAVTQGNQQAAFIMQNSPEAPANTTTSNSTITTNMFMLPPRPLASFGTQFDGLWAITLVDDRYYFQGTGLSLKPQALTTWVSFLTNIAIALGVTITYSSIDPAYGYPEPDSQLWCNLEAAATVLDAIAYNLGRVVVRNLDGTYSLLLPSESQTRVLSNQALGFATRGGEIFYSGAPSRNTIVPSVINVTFPKYVVGDDPVPHFVNPRTTPQRQSLWYEQSYGDVYQITVPITSGGVYASGLSGTSTTTIHVTAKALMSGENATTPLNLSGITSMALQMASDVYGTSIIGIDQTYVGIVNVAPDGLHDIVWTYSAKAKGAYTRITTNQWNKGVWERQNSVIGLSGSTNVPRGVGGPLVAQTIRDSSSGLVPSFAITNAITSSGLNVTLPSVDGLPTQNRWKGTIENEVIYFEGTSGGIYSGGLFSVNVVYRAIDGTLAASHASGSILSKSQPNATYGVNLVTFEKGQFVFGNEWTSGGIQGVNVLPQIQTVKALSATSINVSGLILYSGQVLGFDPIQLSGQQFYNLEYVWLRENNNQTITSGNIYDGHLIGFSPTPTAQGGAGPIYSITQGGAGSTGVYGQANDSPVPGYGPYATVDIANASPTIGNNLSVVVSGDSLNSRNRWVIDNLGEYVRANSGTSFLRRRINFVNGSGTIPIITDASGSDEVQVQINTSGLVNDLCSGTGGAADVTVYPTTRQTFDKNAGFLLTDLTNGRDFISMDFSSGSPLFVYNSQFYTNLYNAYTLNGALVDWNFYKRVDPDTYHACTAPLTPQTIDTASSIQSEWIYAIPFMETRGGTIDRLALYLESCCTSFSGRVRMGIYKSVDATTLYPGALVVGTDTGAINISQGGPYFGATPIAVSIAVSAQLSPGLYYAVLRTDTSVNFGAFNGGIDFWLPGGAPFWNPLGYSLASGGLHLSTRSTDNITWIVSGTGACVALPNTFPVSGFLAGVGKPISPIAPIILRRYSA